MANARKELQSLLEGLGESAQFVSAGSLPPVLPGLEVDGVGDIGTPVSAADARRQQIEAHRCDCTHVTERKGSPQTLVCTKTRGSYERRLKQYQTDLQSLTELKALESGAKRGRRPTAKRSVAKK